jgi:hypothetical protein
MLEAYEEIRRDDELLFALSAREDVSYSQLREVIENLYLSQSRSGYIDDDREEPVVYTIAQALEALGHCDFDFRQGGSQVFVSEPFLARLPLGNYPRAVLTGARSTQTVERVAKSVENEEGLFLNVEAQSENLPLLPVRVEIQGDSVERISGLADDLGIEFRSKPVSFLLASGLGSLEEYLETLSDPKTGELEGWPARRDYDPSDLRFRPDLRKEGRRLSRYTHPTTGQRCYFLFEDNQRVEIDRDWGRYTILKETKLRTIAFDRERARVAIPNGARLPSLYSRALCLCSGFAPTFLRTEQVSISSILQVSRPEKFGYHLYSWVSSRIVETIAEKLGQNMLEAEIEC